MGTLAINRWTSLRRQWFLVALFVVLFASGALPRLLSISQAQELRDGLNRLPQWALVASVLFLMALPLETRKAIATIRRPGAVALACAISFGLGPLVAWLLSWRLSFDLVAGLVIAGAAPCTVASAAVWTRRAGGNDTVAVLVTLITNLGCFLVTPTWVWFLTGREVGTRPLGETILRLGLIVALPTFAAQALRWWAPVRSFADRHGKRLSLAAQWGVLLNVALGAVDAGCELAISEEPLSAWTFLQLGARVALAHAVLLGLGVSAAKGLKMERADQIAVGISGSQKTLLVGVELARQFGGLAMLPMVMYHVIQLMMDTVVADAWKRREPPP